MIKSFSAQISLILCFALASFAQTAAEKPVLIDEFGATSTEDWMARTDAAIVSSLMNSNSENSKARLRIKISGGTDNLYSAAYNYASSLTGYIKRNRGISPEKFSFDFCNLNKENLKTQFFSYSADYDFPKCEEKLDLPKKTVLFEEVYSYFSELSLIPTEESFADIGPSEGDYSKFALDALSNFLEKHPSSKVIVIGYLNANEKWNSKGVLVVNRKRFDKSSELSKIFAKTKNLLIQNGINARQIQFINGGYMNNSKNLEFWLMPEGGALPKPKPDYSTKEKTH